MQINTPWNLFFQRLLHPLRQATLDIPLTCLTVVILLISFLTMISAGLNELSAVNQGLHMALGLGVMLLASQIPPQTYFRIGYTGYGFAILLLILTLILGHSSNGAQRWLILGPISLQPSELVKLILPLTLARWLCQSRSYRYLIALLLTVLPTALVILQPDLGTAVTILIAACILVFIDGIPATIITACFGLLFASLPWIWNHIHAYQKARLLTFLHPEKDPTGQGYHLIQSKIAIGSGGWFGKGWLMGSQGHLHYLPEHHTDFVFSIIAEESGLLGCLVIIALLLAFVFRGTHLARQSSDHFQRMVCATYALLIGFCAFINLSMVCGLLPVVGIPLPFFSYGGSSMLTLMASCGIMMSMASHRRLFNSGT